VEPTRPIGCPTTTGRLPDHDRVADLHPRGGVHVAVAGEHLAGVGDVQIPSTADCQFGVAVAVAAPRPAADVVGVTGGGTHDPGGGGPDDGAPRRPQVGALVVRPLRGAEPGHDRGVHGLGPATLGHAAAECGHQRHVPQLDRQRVVQRQARLPGIGHGWQANAPVRQRFAQLCQTVAGLAPVSTGYSGTPVAKDWSGLKLVWRIERRP